MLEHHSTSFSLGKDEWLLNALFEEEGLALFLHLLFSQELGLFYYSLLSCVILSNSKTIFDNDVRFCH
jgi:hypothetical protein